MENSNRKIQEFNTIKQKEKISAHSHIIGLGLKKGFALSTEEGFVGQKKAREAVGVVSSLVKKNKMAGKAILLVGPSGTGKTALALALSKDLGTKIPFCSIVASEVYSLEVKKTEILIENFRKSIGIKIKELKETYEGEVTEMNINEVVDTLKQDSKRISHIIISLKSIKGTKTLKLDPSIYEDIVREKISIGDIVYIESGSGCIKRLGRSVSFSNEYDLETDLYLPIPKGEVRKRKEVIQNITLHDLDVANASPQGGKDAIAVLNRLGKYRRSEITDKLRTEVNFAVDEMVEKGIAEIVPGVLFIDEVHMLDLECFSYLNKALETPIAPVVFLATNRSQSIIRGTENVTSLHAIPKDLLDRLLIIRTEKYNKKEIHEIIQLRANVENVSISEKGFERLVEIGFKTSLRYVLLLIAPSKICAQTRNSNNIDLCDVSQAYDLFYDASRSITAV